MPGEAFRRYGAPLAIAKACLEGAPDEHRRWLVHAWREAASTATAAPRCGGCLGPTELLGEAGR